MSTLRYSGEIRIRITYLDAHGEVFIDGTPRAPNGKYRCFLQAKGGARTTVYVGAPASLSHAVDSPEAFDDTAHAAIAFANDEDSQWGDYAASNEDGYHIVRSRWSAQWNNTNAVLEEVRKKTSGTDIADVTAGIRRSAADGSATPAGAPVEPAPTSAEPTWRVGRKLGRTLYRDGECVGMVDTAPMAEAIVEAMNGARPAPVVARERTDAEWLELAADGVRKTMQEGVLFVDWLRATFSTTPAFDVEEFIVRVVELLHGLDIEEHETVAGVVEPLLRAVASEMEFR